MQRHHRSRTAPDGRAPHRAAGPNEGQRPAGNWTYRPVPRWQHIESTTYFAIQGVITANFMQGLILSNVNMESAIMTSQSSTYIARGGRHRYKDDRSYSTPGTSQP